MTGDLLTTGQEFVGKLIDVCIERNAGAMTGENTDADAGFRKQLDGGLYVT